MDCARNVFLTQLLRLPTLVIDLRVNFEARYGFCQHGYASASRRPGLILDTVSKAMLDKDRWMTSRDLNNTAFNLNLTSLNAGVVSRIDELSYRGIVDIKRSSINGTMT